MTFADLVTGEAIFLYANALVYHFSDRSLPSRERDNIAVPMSRGLMSFSDYSGIGRILVLRKGATAPGELRPGSWLVGDHPKNLARPIRDRERRVWGHRVGEVMIAGQALGVLMGDDGVDLIAEPW
jgi:hypothetical protein